MQSPSLHQPFLAMNEPFYFYRHMSEACQRAGVPAGGVDASPGTHQRRCERIDAGPMRRVSDSARRKGLLDHLAQAPHAAARALPLPGYAA